MRVSHIKSYMDEQIELIKIINETITNLTLVGKENISLQRGEARKTALRDTWTKFYMTHDAI